MSKKWYSQITRDIVRTIHMGPLVMAPLGIKGAAGSHEIAPARTIEMPAQSGTVSVWRTRKDRDAHIAAINAEHPGAAIAVEV
jgi:hypothetical protein